MTLETVSVALETHFRDNDFCDKRVFLMPSRVSMQIMDAYRNPSCGIVYSGGEPVLNKPYRAFDVHEFDIYIYQTIYKEELVLVGYTDASGEEKGLFDLREQAITLINSFSVENVFSVTIENYSGVEDYADRLGLSAVLGFRIKIKEQV